MHLPVARTQEVAELENHFLLGGELSVRRVGFGAMRLARAHRDGPPRDPATGQSVLRRALELGVNHIDTADFYRSDDGCVRANVLIREALHPYPPDLVVATKVRPVFTKNGPTQVRAAGLRALVESNLESLGLARLDLVYLRVGMTTPPSGESLGERFEVLAALRDEGLIRHLGLSNVDARHLAEARAIAPVAAVQNHFSIWEPDRAGLLKVCEDDGIAFVPFFPLGGSRRDLSGDLRLVRVAARHRASFAQIALAWLLRTSAVTLAIPGTGSLSHLRDNVEAASIRLTDRDLAELAAMAGVRGPQ